MVYWSLELASSSDANFPDSGKIRAPTGCDYLARPAMDERQSVTRVQSRLSLEDIIFTVTHDPWGELLRQTQSVTCKPEFRANAKPS
jgi:hypothetical protein